MSDLGTKLAPALNALDATLDDVSTRAQQNFIGCLLTAVVAHLPAIILDFMACMRGAPPTPPPAGYQPGDRDRCKT